MPRLRGPLFSLGASGRLTRALTLARRLTGPGWLLRGRPADPQTQPQLSWRTMWQLAASLWHQLSAAEQAVWERDGTARGMTGFARYMSQALRPNPGIYLPLAGGTMSGDIDMGGHMLEDLPVPVAAGDAARKAYVDASAGETSWQRYRLAGAYHFSHPQTAGTTGSVSLNLLYAVPFHTPIALTVTKIGVKVTTANPGAARLGIYEDNESIYPGNLVADCGTIDISTNGTKELTGLSISLAAKTLYWLVYLADATTSLNMYGGTGCWGLLGQASSNPTSVRGCYWVARAYGVLPTPYPAAATAAPTTRPAIGVTIT